VQKKGNEHVFYSGCWGVFQFSSEVLIWRLFSLVFARIIAAVIWGISKCKQRGSN
jgi:hypothetical protein